MALIPGHAEAARETRVLGAIDLKEAVLDSEQAKREARFDPVKIENQGVILLATDDRGAGPWLLISPFARSLEGPFPASRSTGGVSDAWSERRNYRPLLEISESGGKGRQAG